VDKKLKQWRREIKSSIKTYMINSNSKNIVNLGMSSILNRYGIESYNQTIEDLNLSLYGFNKKDDNKIK